MTPARVSPRASITSTSPCRMLSIPMRCMSVRLSTGTCVMSSRPGMYRRVNAGPAMRVPGASGATSCMNVLYKPYSVSTEVSVAVLGMSRDSSVSRDGASCAVMIRGSFSLVERRVPPLKGLSVFRFSWLPAGFTPPTLQVIPVDQGSVADGGTGGTGRDRAGPGGPAKAATASTYPSGEPVSK